MDNPLPTRRALKRSASTASLPTPPRTYRRRTRGRSRGSCDSDSDSYNEPPGRELLSSDEEAPSSPAANGGNSNRKKRRLEKSVQEEEEEEAKFWLGGTQASSSKPDESTKAASSRPQGPLLYRKLQSNATTSSSQMEQALVSPPPSHRKTVHPFSLPASPSPATTSSLPATPKAKVSAHQPTSDSDFGPLRDSPSNPFIATPANSNTLEALTSPTLGKESPPAVYDRPTVTYVFRGVRRVYQNPMYDHAKNRALSPPPNSKLPVDDPAFSPDPTCKPRLLFPEAHKKRKVKSRRQASLQSGSKRKGRASAGNTSDIDEEEHVHLGGGLKRPNSGLAMPLTLDAELRKAAALNEEDDVFC